MEKILLVFDKKILNISLKIVNYAEYEFDNSLSPLYAISETMDSFSFF